MCTSQESHINTLRLCTAIHIDLLISSERHRIFAALCQSVVYLQLQITTLNDLLSSSFQLLHKHLPRQFFTVFKYLFFFFAFALKQVQLRVTINPGMFELRDITNFIAKAIQCCLGGLTVLMGSTHVLEQCLRKLVCVHNSDKSHMQKPHSPRENRSYLCRSP